MANKRASSSSQQNLFISHYEQDFLLRTLGDLNRRPDVALGLAGMPRWPSPVFQERVALLASADRRRLDRLSQRI